MSHGIQMFIAALVMMLPAIVVHFSMVSARKDMNNKMNEKIIKKNTVWDEKGYLCIFLNIYLFHI